MNGTAESSHVAASLADHIQQKEITFTAEPVCCHTERVSPGLTVISGNIDSPEAQNMSKKHRIYSIKHTRMSVLLYLWGLSLSVFITCALVSWFWSWIWCLRIWRLSVHSKVSSVKACYDSKVYLDVNNSCFLLLVQVPGAWNGPTAAPCGQWEKKPTHYFQSWLTQSNGHLPCGAGKELVPVMFCVDTRYDKVFGHEMPQPIADSRYNCPILTGTGVSVGGAQVRKGQAWSVLGLFVFHLLFEAHTERKRKRHTVIFKCHVKSDRKCISLYFF